MDALTGPIFEAAGYVAGVLVLIVGAYLTKLLQEKLGVEVEQRRLDSLSKAAQHAVLYAEQKHKTTAASLLKQADEMPGVGAQRDMLIRQAKTTINERMHQTAVEHILKVAPKVAKKVDRELVDSAVHAAVRGLKLAGTSFVRGLR